MGEDSICSSSSHQASHRRRTGSVAIGDDPIVVGRDMDDNAMDDDVDSGTMTESGEVGRGDNVGSRKNCGW